jgi:DNA-binding response OmpR family regulator
MDTVTRIALIDDDRDWVETLGEYLHRQGFSILAAHDGAGGLALLERGGIPLALVDLNMPGMTGLELLRRVRQRHIPVTVLVVTSNDDPTLAARVRAEGGLAVLPKTAPPRVLLESVRQAFTRLRPPSRGSRLDKPWNRLLPGPRGIRLRTSDVSSN